MIVCDKIGTPELTTLFLIGPRDRVDHVELFYGTACANPVSTSKLLPFFKSRACASVSQCWSPLLKRKVVRSAYMLTHAMCGYTGTGKSQGYRAENMRGLRRYEARAYIVTMLTMSLP